MKGEGRRGALRSEDPGRLRQIRSNLTGETQGKRNKRGRVRRGNQCGSAGAVTSPGPLGSAPLCAPSLPGGPGPSSLEMPGRSPPRCWLCPVSPGMATRSLLVAPPAPAGCGGSSWSLRCPGAEAKSCRGVLPAAPSAGVASLPSIPSPPDRSLPRSMGASLRARGGAARPGRRNGFSQSLERDPASISGASSEIN